jgi:hypothetical protein
LKPWNGYSRCVTHFTSIRPRSVRAFAAIWTTCTPLVLFSASLPAA